MDVVILIVVSLNLVMQCLIMGRFTRLEQSTRAIGRTAETTLRSVSSTQNALKLRVDRGQTRAKMDPKPKVEQPYADRGIRQPANGSQAGAPGGEGTATRIGKIERRSVGGKQRDASDS